MCGLPLNVSIKKVWISIGQKIRVSTKLASDAFLACYKQLILVCTVNSKINGTLKGVYWSISKLHLILAVANLLAHNNVTISYYVQVHSLRLKQSVASKWTSKHLWGCHLFCCWWYLWLLSRQRLWTTQINSLLLANVCMLVWCGVNWREWSDATAVDGGEGRFKPIHSNIHVKWLVCWQKLHQTLHSATVISYNLN